MSCIFCSGVHQSWRCQNARKLALQERQSAVQNVRCCFLCLKEGHSVRTCQFKLNCQLCGENHNLLLCRNLSRQNFSRFEKEEKGQEREVHQDEALVNISKVSAVVLQTLVVIVRGVGVKLIVRSIIDSVSQRSYILKTIAEEMGYQPKKKEHLQHSLFGGSKTSACQHEVFTIYLSNLSEKYNCHFDTLGQPIICDTISSLNLKVYLIESSNQDIQLTDDLVGPIEILIGADVMGKLITENRKQLKFGTDRNRN
ncbi:hypothetical protein AVEN_22784-1 [Araneus ventricosus]|uniref:Peptidase aspartic putative domain-containing protein n=1 Tax=Araneus ventricosus TaxID=182803 RepID=A0A4Y2EDU4_ARAVE|nr:hypothetical protein AVEN_22784-1 [Araneus ventricosus]